MKRITVYLLLLALLLAGCHQDKEVAPIESESFALLETIDDEKRNPLPSEQTESSYQRVTEASKPEEFKDSTELPQTTQPSIYQSEVSTESETEETVSVNEQTEADIPPATEAPPKTEVQEPQHNEELPSQPVTEPTGSEPTASSQPVTEPEPEPTEEIESEDTQETEPTTETATPFEIGTWISFAQSYAQSIGLNLDSAAVDCWDNPITAGAHCIYLERDICSRLDRYNRDEDITDVWIWAVEIGNGCYDLYIGYA